MWWRKRAISPLGPQGPGWAVALQLRTRAPCATLQRAWDDSGCSCWGDPRRGSGGEGRVASNHRRCMGQLPTNLKAWAVRMLSGFGLVIFLAMNCGWVLFYLLSPAELRSLGATGLSTPLVRVFYWLGSLIALKLPRWAPTPTRFLRRFSLLCTLYFISTALLTEMGAYFPPPHVLSAAKAIAAMAQAASMALLALEAGHIRVPNPARGE